MNSYPYLALSAAIFFELAGTVFLQASQHFSKPFSAAMTVICYAVATFFLSVSLKTIPVGIAYATWNGIGIALITGIGFVMFKQKMDLPAIIGIAFIAIGAVLITGFSQSKFH